MATRRSRRLYGSSYRYPYRKGYYYSGKSKRRAIGNQKAANQQKDICNVNLNIIHKCNTLYKRLTIGADVFKSGVYALNMWDLLRRNEFYQSYSTMYDQVRIDGIKIKITPTQWTFNTLGNSNVQNAITVVTAWDRTGLSKSQIKLITNNVATEGENIGIIGLEGNQDGLYVTMNDEIATYSSSQTRSLNPGSSLNINRWLYPSSMAEKSYFVNTSDLKQWYTKYDGAVGRFIGINAPYQVLGNPSLFSGATDDVIIGTVMQTPEISDNPCSLFEDSNIPFKPTLLIGVETGVNTTIYNQDDFCETPPVIFTIEADVQVTFRGLRKSKVVE